MNEATVLQNITLLYEHTVLGSSLNSLNNRSGLVLCGSNASQNPPACRILQMYAEQKVPRVQTQQQPHNTFQYMLHDEKRSLKRSAKSRMASST